MTKHTLIVMMGVAGCGKAQPVDTIIPTPNGNKKLGDIKVGDYVFDKHGKATEVLGVFPQGLMDTYEVVLTDGRKTECSDQHLWTYYTNKGNIHTDTLENMLKKSIRQSSEDTKRLGKCRYRLPRHKCVEYSHKEFEIHPYIIGAFLGDGCCKERQLTISSQDEEIPNRIADLLPFDCTAIKQDQSYNWHFKLNKPYLNEAGNSMVLKAQTRKVFKNFIDEICCYSYEKRIPQEYLYGDKNQRFELLRGILDTDGSIQKSNGRFTINVTQTSYDLIKDIIQLVESLGYKAGTIHEDNRQKKYTKNCYSITITVPNIEKEEVFYLSRKKEIAKKAKDKKMRFDWNTVGISEVNNLNIKKEMICILVDNDEHLYLTNNFIVTHNTTLAKVIQDSHDDCIIISRDQIRFALLQEGEDYFAHEDEVVNKYYDAVSRALEVHKYVIADATQILPASRNKLFKNISIPKGTKIVGVWIEVDEATAIKNNRQRSGRAYVPEDTIKKMYKQKVSPAESEPFDEVIYVMKHVDMAIGKQSPKISDVFDKLKNI